jgi:hypothetical protein
MAKTYKREDIEVKEVKKETTLHEFLTLCVKKFSTNCWA